MRFCTNCKKEKFNIDFTKYGSYCKNCVSIKNKLYRQNNKEKCNNYKKQEKYKLKTKQYKQSEKYKNWGKEYYKKNIKRINQYYIDNKEIIKYRVKIWSLKNKYRNNATFQFKYKTNPYIKLRRLVSNRINEWLEKLGSNKNGKSITKYLPYTIKELKNYLESLFEPWMNWQNHGKYNPKTWKNDDPSTWTWQIDHIIPQSNLSYSSMNDENFKKCWSLTNLRPLSAKQNIIDGSNRARHK